MHGMAIYLTPKKITSLAFILYAVFHLDKTNTPLNNTLEQQYKPPAIRRIENVTNQDNSGTCPPKA
jgi:hypothetical protein